MSGSIQYHFPEFLARELGSDKSLTDKDLKEFDAIYLKAEEFQYPSAQTDNNWLKLKNNITSNHQPPQFSFVKNIIHLRAVKWAVAAIIILSISIGFFQFYLSPVSQNPIAEITTNHQKKIILSDGSEITLNTFSSISSNNFNANNRTITLTGEAYFDIKNNQHPFVVKTNAGSINVFGTKFNIKNRENEPFQVALSSGKISFSSANKIYVLNPGDIITKDITGRVYKSTINSTTLCWLEDKLVFENESLSTIISSLENQYHVKLEYDEQLKSEKLTLTFNKLTAHQAADLLSKALNSKVVVKEL